MRRIRWLVLIAALVYAVLSTLTLARAQPTSAQAGDAATGATLHEKDCVGCHVRRMGGDGTSMYTRAQRKVTSPAQLDAQIAACNSQLSAGYFPEEEAHIAAFLNLRYYKFAR